jgi:hypothetical protein
LSYHLKKRKYPRRIDIAGTVRLSKSFIEIDSTIAAAKEIMVIGRIKTLSGPKKVSVAI